MRLDNQTLLGSYLAHMHANIRRLVSLDFERANHPDSRYAAPQPSTERLAIMKQWEDLRKMLYELLSLQLKPFGELAAPGPYHKHEQEAVSGPACARYTMAKVKRLADRHRRHHPEFSLLKSWDLKAKRRLTRDELDDLEIEQYVKSHDYVKQL